MAGEWGPAAATAVTKAVPLESGSSELGRPLANKAASRQYCLPANHDPTSTTHRTHSIYDEAIYRNGTIAHRMSGAHR